MSTEPIRALILSGGGGRGAFHAGVYKYLMKNHKVNVDSNHVGAWEPDIIVGTSIGAVNGAAIAQGMSADQLVNVWKSLEEQDIQGLPPGMRGIARWVARAIFKEVMDVRLAQVSPQEATSPIPKDKCSNGFRAHAASLVLIYDIYYRMIFTLCQQFVISRSSFNRTVGMLNTQSTQSIFSTLRALGYLWFVTLDK